MMWGDRSPRAKLTGDSRRGFEAVLIGDCRSFRSLARNWPLRLLRLLQHYLPTRDSCAAAIASLFDHLVGAREQHRRHVDADRLCGLKIDDELEFCRLLNGQI